MDGKEKHFYHDMSTTMIAKRLLSDYCKAKTIFPYVIADIGPEGFAELWVKEKLDGTTLQDEVVSKFMQLLYNLGNRGKKRNKKEIE